MNELVVNWECVTSLFTMLGCVIAVFVPFIENYLNNKIKLYLTFENSLFIMDSCIVHVSNISNKIIEIKNVYIQINKTNYPTFENDLELFPINLPANNTIDIKFSKQIIINLLSEYNKKFPITIVVYDINGKVYKKRTNQYIGD